MAICSGILWQRRIVRVVLCLSVLLSCLGCTDKDRIAHDIQQLVSHKVEVPYGRLVAYRGHNPYKDYSQKAPLKLIVYVDSTECSSCYIGNIRKWEPLLDSLWVYKDILRVTILLSPSESERGLAFEKLKYSKFKYPLCIDTCNAFASANKHIPANKVCHIFLLDEDNEVILVGNPIGNKKINDLLDGILKERMGE